MKEANTTVPILSAQYNELDETDRKLVDTARAATGRSYAPYSKFRVGAAILLDNGETVAGSNQENAAFPSGLCAERTAAFYAHSRYPDAKFVTIAVAAIGTDGKEIPCPIAPCGACRQSLLEYETLAQHNVKVILAGRSEIFIVPSIRDLLPVTFSEF